MGTVGLPVKGSLSTTVVEGPTDELGGCVVGGATVVVGATEVAVVDSVVVVVSQSFGALTVVSLLPPPDGRWPKSWRSRTVTDGMPHSCQPGIQGGYEWVSLR
jgi:hypothetical protein